MFTIQQGVSSMGLNVGKIKSTGGGPRQKEMEEGTSKCRVVQIVDLGVQPQRAFEGKPKPPIHQIRMTYEFTDEFCLDEDGNEMEDKPRWLSEEFPLHPLSADLAKSTKRYKAMDPELVHGGDFTMLGGAPVNVTVVNNKSSKKRDDGEFIVYNNIGAVTSMKAKDVKKLPELVNPITIFSRDEPTKEAWETLPDWLQDKIKEGLDFAGCPLDVLLKGGKPEEKQEKGEPESQHEPEDTGEDKPW